jgi:hypothetical protein
LFKNILGLLPAKLWITVSTDRGVIVVDIAYQKRFWATQEEAEETVNEVLVALAKRHIITDIVTIKGDK